ncbi:ABC transporter permease, partial [Niallia circulans]|uniref:ABC transporter permease n=1 Tax=Niallia circulans TaxID=1397 RepID=UPI0030099C21
DLTDVIDDSRRVILLDYNTSTELFGSGDKAIGKGVSIKGEDYEVIATIKKADNYSIGGGYSYISKNSMDNLIENNSITSIDLYLLPGESKEKVFEDAKSELMVSHPNIQGEYMLDDPQEITKAFESIINGLTAFIAAVTAISLFVGGIGVMNIMYVSVSERKREIGIRRAMGAKQRTIMLQFLIEAIMVTVLAGLIGILFGYFCARLVGIVLPFEPVLTAGSFIGATIISVIIGIIFGIIPASKAAKLDPIEAIYK